MKSGCDPEDFEYIIQDYEEHIESIEKEIAKSEVEYDAVCEQALKYAGLNTLGAFVLTVLAQKKTPRYMC